MMVSSAGCKWAHRHRAMNGISGTLLRGYYALFAWNTYNTTFNNPLPCPTQGRYSNDPGSLVHTNASDIISTPPGLSVWLSYPLPLLSLTIVLFPVQTSSPSVCSSTPLPLLPLFRYTPLPPPSFLNYFPLIFMFMAPPQQPTPSPTLANGVQVVTLTVYSTGSTGSTGVPASSGGGSGVPIGAIAGGAAGGITLAVAMVLVWKYWGLVIKRTEKRKRKETVCSTFRSSPVQSVYIILLLFSLFYRGMRSWLTIKCSKRYSPCGRTRGGTRRRG